LTTATLQARMKHPVFIIPSAMDALQALTKTIHAGGVSPELHELVNLRASQINGCSVCAIMHSRELKRLGETDARIFTVAAWRDSPYFTDEERAALALTEAVTRLSDQSDPVPDEIWDEAVQHYDEQTLAALVLAIANINVWNRLNVATRQVAREEW
jgi:AhpD family alkylhydroperoxidase